MERRFTDKSLAKSMVIEALTESLSKVLAPKILNELKARTTLAPADETLIPAEVKTSISNTLTSHFTAPVPDPAATQPAVADLNMEIEDGLLTNLNQKLTNPLDDTLATALSREVKSGIPEAGFRATVFREGELRSILDQTGCQGICFFPCTVTLDTGNKIKTLVAAGLFTGTAKPDEEIFLVDTEPCPPFCGGYQTFLET